MIPDEVCIAAIEIVLKPLGSTLRHYESRHRVAAIEAMRGVLTAERDRALSLVEDVRVSPAWSGREADNICGAIATEIRGEGA